MFYVITKARVITLTTTRQVNVRIKFRLVSFKASISNTGKYIQSNSSIISEKFQNTLKSDCTSITWLLNFKDNLFKFPFHSNIKIQVSYLLY